MESKARTDNLDPAATERYLGIAKQLLAAGCKPDARVPLWKEFGFDPLSVAQSIKCQPLVELLEAAIPLKPPARKKKEGRGKWAIHSLFMLGDQTKLWLTPF